MNFTMGRGVKILSEISPEITTHKRLKRSSFTVKVGFTQADTFKVTNNSSYLGSIQPNIVFEYFRVSLFAFCIEIEYSLV